MEAIMIRDEGHRIAYDRELLRRQRNLRRKHIQELKRKLFFLACSLVVIIILAILSGTILSNAKTVSDAEEYKYFTRYTVGYQDTLWDIASEYADAHYDGIQDYLDEVKAINHIDDLDDIQAGKVLLLPYYSEAYLQ